MIRTPAGRWFNWRSWRTWRRRDIDDTCWLSCVTCAGQGRIWNTNLSKAWLCPTCLGIGSTPPRHHDQDAE